MIEIRPIEIKASRLLLVEGKDDVSFIDELLHQLSIEQTVFQIINYEGVSQLRTKLGAIAASSNNFDTVTHLAILRDRDFEEDKNPFQSIQDALKANGLASPNSLGKDGIKNEKGITIGIFLFPNNHDFGMLENLCWDAFDEAQLKQCIEDYLLCLSNDELLFIENALPKAKMNILIASKSSNAAIPSKDRRVWNLENAVRKNWFPWESPIFDAIKTFLHELAK